MLAWAFNGHYAMTRKLLSFSRAFESLSTIDISSYDKYYSLKIKFCGEGGIRTHGPGCPRQLLSREPRSATPAPLL